MNIRYPFESLTEKQSENAVKIGLAASLAGGLVLYGAHGPEAGNAPCRPMWGSPAVVTSLGYDMPPNFRGQPKLIVMVDQDDLGKSAVGSSEERNCDSFQIMPKEQVSDTLEVEQEYERLDQIATKP